MALSAVGLVIGKIENEASLIGGVCDEVKQLKLEFESMRSFMEDAAKTTVQTEGEKTWVANVRDLAYEISDFNLQNPEPGETLQFHISDFNLQNPVRLCKFQISISRSMFRR
ncbi:Disease resistance protein RPM1 [Camellia lanceoleosa]|uniref:Disease resistance protein RPM1 n=1 Tax=Camellia lanceoleosa TaxID=1840588 RepID=A0ACC0IP05_9ERIC|nr:Disease resistance protein RPM1 [Camellia lanceoleosa]